jgi:hypothetical protein
MIREIQIAPPNVKKRGPATTVVIPNSAWMTTPLWIQVSNWCFSHRVSLMASEDVAPSDFARNMAIHLFLHDKAAKEQHLLFLYPSVIPPAETLDLLHESGKDLIGGIVRRWIDDKPQTEVYVDNASLDDGDGIQPVDQIGAGCLLVSRQALEQLGDPPHFEPLAWGKQREGFWGFCNRLRALGIQAHAHWDIRCSFVDETNV